MIKIVFLWIFFRRDAFRKAIEILHLDMIKLMVLVFNLCLIIDIVNLMDFNMKKRKNA